MCVLCAVCGVILHGLYLLCRLSVCVVVVLYVCVLLVIVSVMVYGVWFVYKLLCCVCDGLMCLCGLVVVYCVLLYGLNFRVMVCFPHARVCFVF